MDDERDEGLGRPMYTKDETQARGERRRHDILESRDYIRRVWGGVLRRHAGG